MTIFRLIWNQIIVMNQYFYFSCRSVFSELCKKSKYLFQEERLKGGKRNEKGK